MARSRFAISTQEEFFAGANPSVMGQGTHTFLELKTQRDRAISLVWPLLLEFPRTVNTHHGQLDAMSGHQAMGADPDSGLGNPWSASDTVA